MSPRADRDGAREACVGCGAHVEVIDGPIHRYITSAPACWALFGDLTARVYAEPSLARVHQFIVDTYAVQHPGGDDPQAIRSVAMHLMNLYRTLVLGGRVEDGPAFLHTVPKDPGRFHRLSPPAFSEARTIVDVIAAEDAPAEVEAWASDVWRAWGAHHDRIVAWYDALA